MNCRECKIVITEDDPRLLINQKAVVCFECYFYAPIKYPMFVPDFMYEDPEEVRP